MESSQCPPRLTCRCWSTRTSQQREELAGLGSDLGRRRSPAGGVGGAVAVDGLHLALVEAAVAAARRAEERLGARGRRRHELAAAVHGVPADAGGVVALALLVVHHLAVLPLGRHRRAVGERLGRRPVLLGPHGRRLLAGRRPYVGAGCGV